MGAFTPKPFDFSREFKSITFFRADGAIWEKGAAIDKARLGERLCEKLFNAHRIDFMTDAEIEAVKANPIPAQGGGGTEVIRSNPKVNPNPRTADDDAADIAGMTVAAMSAKLPDLDLDMLNRVKAAELAKPESDQRSSALSAIDAAISKSTTLAPIASEPAATDDAPIVLDPPVVAQD